MRIFREYNVSASLSRPACLAYRSLQGSLHTFRHRQERFAKAFLLAVMRLCTSLLHHRTTSHCTPAAQHAVSHSADATQHNMQGRVYILIVLCLEKLHHPARRYEACESPVRVGRCTLQLKKVSHVLYVPILATQGNRGCTGS